MTEQAERTPKLREILAQFGTYEEHEPGMWYWKAFDVDSMTDEEIVALARRVAGREDGPAA